MSSSHSLHDKEKTTYMLDVESGAEMVRLLDQDKAITESMGGVFPERSDLTLATIHDVLDIACGPGGWAIEVAHTYPKKRVVGIDISNTMISYASANARVRKLTNIQFRVMNAIKPLEFPDESFDLVNARGVVGFVTPELWPRFLAECKRILRPNGTLRLTEGEWGIASTPAFEELSTLGAQLGHTLGVGFSPTGKNLGITAVLPRLIRNADFQNIQQLAHAIDFSSGRDAHEGMCQDFRFLFKLLQPLMVNMNIATQEKVDDLYEKVLIEMQSEDFCAIEFLLTVWGEKA